MTPPRMIRSKSVTAVRFWDQLFDIATFPNDLAPRRPCGAFAIVTFLRLY